MEKLLTLVSLRRLQVFLAVCDTLHMARAAERLGIAQPALSQQIRGLEQALGVRLFHRRKRGIDLTEAGTVCRREAERLLALHRGAVDRVRRTARGEMGRLALGYVGSAMFERRFPAQLRTMRETFPDVQLTLQEGGVAALIAALEKGELDAALIRAPVHIEPPLRHRFHSSQDLVAILPRGHELARKARIPISRLAAEAMVGFPDPPEMGIMRVATDLAHAAGVQIQVRWTVSEVGSVLGLVAAGLGYGIVPKDIALLTGPEIVTRPLAEPDVQAELWLVWRDEQKTPALDRFLEIAVPRPRP